ncbi:uncharacterized protein ACB058_004094 isoform 2-T2 [Synchiropus picturatus]
MWDVTNMDADAEALGEQLYSRIFPAYKEEAGKLTGMLLELPGPTLHQMLRDERMLTSAVEKAVRALQEPSKLSDKDEDDASASSDSIGEQLFELVSVYNTGHSQKITGMLLEQEKDVILKLLSNPKLLQEQNVEETDVSDSSDADDRETLGEKLFSLVEKLDPLRANDLTGMLLEMDSAALLQLLTDRSMLQAAVEKAQTVLDSQA